MAANPTNPNNKKDALSKIETLRRQGVTIPDPQSVYIDDDVDVRRISGHNVLICPGARIHGKTTFIGQGAKIGTEGPATLKNARLGSNVELKSGFYEGSVFLKDVIMGSGSHVREGCLLEEGSSAAHTVGLKQTILFPFATLGSLINFCDCLMSGGTSRKDHSEVGSSYIHFNYTPNQDKATPSLIGDVPHGVMLSQPPIFLGGQGGLAGPCRIAFGTVIAAGAIHRKDVLKPNRLVIDGKGKGGQIRHRPGLYSGIRRIVKNNLIYIANLIALKHWYKDVRSLFISDDFPEPIFSGATQTIDLAISERLKRLRGFSEKMPKSIDIQKRMQTGNEFSEMFRQQEEFNKKWPEIENLLINGQNREEGNQAKDKFLEHASFLIHEFGPDYITVIKNLPDEISAYGTDWLNGIIEEMEHDVSRIIPALELMKTA